MLLYAISQLPLLVASFLTQLFSRFASRSSQNIDFHDGTRILGTNIAKILYNHKFKGLVVILSANSSRIEEAIYMKVPGVDCVCGKHMTTTQKLNRIKSAWAEKNKPKRRRPWRESPTVYGGGSKM